jgi:hypothetical protein
MINELEKLLGTKEGTIVDKIKDILTKYAVEDEHNPQ